MALKPGDVVVGVLAGAVEPKVRPAVVIASTTFLVEHPDVLAGILTTKLPKPATSTDCILVDWQLAGHSRRVVFQGVRAYGASLGVDGHRSPQ
jgi:hypothetical protein